MFINDLSDDCLRLIFSRLSLSCKLTLHRICPRWRSLQYSVTCQCTSLRLLLGTGSNSRKLLANSCLKVPYLDQIEPHNSAHFSEHTTLELYDLGQNVTCQLKQLLPNITSLEICLNDCEHSVMNAVLKLLRFWSTGLKFLSLYYDRIGTDSTRSLKQVLSHFKLINEHCLALDTLSIEIQGGVEILQDMRYNRGHPEEPITNQLDLRCLARLKEFRFYSKDPIEVLFHSLKSYASDRLKKIAIGNYRIDDCPTVGDNFQAMPKIVSKLTLLGIKLPIEYSKFTSLTTISMDLDYCSWTQFTTNLSPLKSLIHVKLRLYRSKLSQYDSTPSYQLAQMPSIRIIQINLAVPHTQTYSALQSRHWGWIFPSLQLLELELNNLSEVPIQDKKVRAARLSLLLEPFKWQCTKLRRIVTLDKYYHYEDEAERKVWEMGECYNWKEVVAV